MMDGGRKSITLEEIVKDSNSIPLGYRPRIDYLKIIDVVYTF